MRATIEPGHRLIRGTLLQNGVFFGDGIALLNPDGRGSFQLITPLMSLHPDAAHAVKDAEGYMWPLDSLAPSANGDTSHYDLTHSIQFGESPIAG
jgi:hypothetical protein